MLAARFWKGVSSSTFSTMVSGLITDIFRVEERDTAMALFAGAAIFGVGLGPIFAGFIVRYTTWRWIFGSQAILNAVLVAVFALFIGETRETTILQRKVDILNAWESAAVKEVDTDLPRNRSPIQWRIAAEDVKTDLRGLLVTSLTRPFQLLLTEPVVAAFSLWVGFSWAVLYICLSVIPLVFQDVYAFEPQQGNAIFAASCIGAVLATGIGMHQERIANYYGLLPKTPEARLYCCCVESWLLPFGVSIYYFHHKSA